MPFSDEGIRESGKLKRPSVISIDDDPAFNRLFTRILSKLGVKVETFETPDEFLARHVDKDARQYSVLEHVRKTAGVEGMGVVHLPIPREVRVAVCLRRYDERDYRTPS